MEQTPVSAPKHAFANFVAKFPPVSMPVTLGEATHHVFSAENDLLPESMVEQFILPVDSGETDEFTEFLPCFGIEDAGPFIALVWWKAGLLTYEYHLATFMPSGKAIDHKIIAFTRGEDGNIRRAVSTIDEDLVIFVAEGISKGGDDYMDPTTSKTYEFEIMNNGEIAG
jgi:hypothetical protein